MDPQDFQQGVLALGIIRSDIDQLRELPFEDAQARLEEIQARAKKRYRKLALELHPDRNNGDEVKAKLFNLVTQVNKQLQDLKIVRRPQVRQRFVFVQQPATTIVFRTTPFRRPAATPPAPRNANYDARKVAFIRF